MIHRETRDSVLVLRMEHGKVSAIDAELFEELIRALEEAETHPCAAIVLTGTGKAFSAGVDLFRILDGGAPYIDRFLPVLSDGLEKLFLFPKPAVAAINGHAIAGGCILACACDYRVMAQEGATIGVPELRVGVPFPAIPLELVRFTVAPQHLQEVVYTGRTYGGEDALKRGLTDELAAPDAVLDRACEMAAGLGSIPAGSYRVTKMQLRTAALDHARQYSRDAEAAALWRSPDIHNVIRAYLQKTIGKGR